MGASLWKEYLLRSLRMLVASGLALSIMLALVSGCGGDASRARGFMSEGDAQLAKMKAISARLTSSTNTLFEGVFAGGKVDAAGFQKDAVAVRKAADEFSAAAVVAKKQYSSIDTLKNVQGYKDYADAQIKALDLNEQGLALLKAFLDKWTPAIAESGFDPVAFVGAAKELSTQSGNIATEIEKLENQAAKVKKAEKL